jgi:hypothetical protein
MIVHSHTNKRNYPNIVPILFVPGQSRLLSRQLVLHLLDRQSRVQTLRARLGALPCQLSSTGSTADEGLTLKIVWHR